jgi:DNA-binding transcriptional LysR family regulator
VSSSVKNLENQLQLNLLDRSGYRVTLTDAGRSFYEQTRVFLQDAKRLRDHATQLAMGEESELRVVIGDLSPLPETLGLLRSFFDSCPGTRLHLHFEAIAGPWERLFEDEADLIFHHIDKSDPRLEFVDLFTVKLVPVVAPNFLRFPVSRSITPEQMRDYVQCVIRDTARHSPPSDYFLLEGARSWTVSDQLMKKELILQGMGWGHLPRYLIEPNLREASPDPDHRHLLQGRTKRAGRGAAAGHAARSGRQSAMAVYRGPGGQDCPRDLQNIRRSAPALTALPARRCSRSRPPHRTRPCRVQAPCTCRRCP